MEDRLPKPSKLLKGNMISIQWLKKPWTNYRKRAQFACGNSQAVVGQDEVIEELLISLLAGALPPDRISGLGKTLLVKTVANCLSLGFKRIQFTPDLMPADVLGSEVVDEDPGHGKLSFRFVPGPIFSQVVLADEINLTPPKTQAALLEAMEERQVTVAGETRPLDCPFFVLATQNPIELEGTYPLPEAQLDRFLNPVIKYLPEVDEVRMVGDTTGEDRLSLSRTCPVLKLRFCNP